jgi:hypothetical protein
MDSGIEYVLQRLLGPRSEMLENAAFWNIIDFPGKTNLHVNTSIMSSSKVTENDFQITLDVADAVCMALDEAGIRFNMARQSSGFIIFSERTVTESDVNFLKKHLLTKSS